MDIVKTWHDAKCVGTIMTNDDVDIPTIIKNILVQIYNKNPDYRVLIKTRDFKEGGKISDALVLSDNKFRNLIKSHNIFITTLNAPAYTDYKLIIVVNPKGLDVSEDLIKELSTIKFKLVLLDKLITDVKASSTLYKFCPLLNYVTQTIKPKEKKRPPVKEELVPIVIDPNSKEGKQLEEYNRYINESINIFGDFKTMDCARRGDVEHNISAQEICNQIAEVNGWNIHLDMSLPFNVQIDEMYNPNILNERASLTYDVIRKRTEFLACYQEKIKQTRLLVLNTDCTDILIISKTSEFAKKLTDDINDASHSYICGNYHPLLETIQAVDINGNQLYYKSGAHKGEPKKMAAKAQMTLANQLYNINRLKVLSANSAPNKDLSCNIDIVIITSPLCDTIEDYMARLDKVTFNPNGVKLYTLYVKGSIEEKKLLNRKLMQSHKIVNNCENNAVYDKNNDVIVVD